VSTAEGVPGRSSDSKVDILMEITRDEAMIIIDMAETADHEHGLHDAGKTFLRRIHDAYPDLIPWYNERQWDRLLLSHENYCKKWIL
jgi:hypothetical protein